MSISEATAIIGTAAHDTRSRGHTLAAEWDAPAAAPGWPQQHDTDEQRVTDFLTAWNSFTYQDGTTIPLPPRWRTRVLMVARAYPCAAEDWREACDRAADAANDGRLKPKSSHFAYMHGVMIGKVASRYGHDERGQDAWLADACKADHYHAAMVEKEAQRRRGQEVMHARQADYARQRERAREAQAHHPNRCTATRKDGERCRSRARQPGGRCHSHCP